MGLLSKVLSPAVGLTTEAWASRKDGSSTPSKLPPGQQPDPNPDQKHPSGPTATSPQSSLGPPPAYTETLEPQEDFDEEQWQLDDAAAASEPPSEPPKGNVAGPATVEHLVRAFTTTHPIPSGLLGQALELPVIIPQRRPRDKSRGFVRAYAPLLSDIGLPEPSWLSFLDSFDEAIKLTPVFTVINIAAQTAGLVGTFIPTPTLTAVVTAVQVSEIIARRTYERARTNAFLDEMNARWFMPQGLFCLVMTYKPSSSAAAVPLDLSSTVAKVSAEGQGKFKSQFKKLRGADGKSRGEAQLPPAAPLVYPSLDRASDEQRGWWARKSAFVTDYMDRRAQASYASENPGSKLGMEPEFKSKWAHPDALGKYDRRQGGGPVRGLRSDVRDIRGGGYGGGESSAYRGQHDYSRDAAYGRGREDEFGEPYASGSAYEQRFYARGRHLGREARGERRDMRRERSAGGGLLGGPGLISGRLGAGLGGRSRSHDGRGRGSGGGLLGGGPLGLVTGAVQMARGKDAKEVDPRKYSLRGADGKSGAIGYVKQALRPDVLYLMVVPMPSEEEMREAREGLEVREE